MKTILKIVLTILVLSTISCKSSSKLIDNDIQQTTIESKDGIRANVSNIKIDDFNTNSYITEYTKYEPIYYKKNGKDTVELRQVTYKKELKSETGKKVEGKDSTVVSEKTNTTNTLVDNSVIETKFEGFDILQSVLGAVVSFFAGPFKFVLWIVAILLIIPLYRFIKRLLTKNKTTENKN